MRFSTVALFVAAASANMMPVEEVSSDAVPTTTAVHHGKGKHHGGKGRHSTTSTIYATEVHTITDCPDTVTKCPHDKIKVITETIAISTTVCPVDDDDYPVATSVPVYNGHGKGHGHGHGHGYNHTVTYKHPKVTSTYCSDDETSTIHNHQHHYTAKPEPHCGETKVKTISTSYTTVLPTVIYETYTEGCGAEPTHHSHPAYPSSGTGCNGHNCSTAAKPVDKPAVVVTAGAASAVGSVFFAAAAGLAAYAFA